MKAISTSTTWDYLELILYCIHLTGQNGDRAVKKIWFRHPARLAFVWEETQKLSKILIDIEREDKAQLRKEQYSLHDFLCSVSQRSFEAHEEPMEVDFETSAEPMEVDFETSAEPMEVDFETSAEPMEVDFETSAEPMEVDFETFAEPVEVDFETSAEAMEVDFETSAEAMEVDFSTPAEPMDVDWDTSMRGDASLLYCIVLFIYCTTPLGMKSRVYRTSTKYRCWRW